MSSTPRRSAPYAGWVRRVNRIAAVYPSLGLRLAALSGRALGARLGDAWTPNAAEVEARLGLAEPRAVARLQARIASCELRNRVLMYLLKRRGPADLRRLLRVRGAEVLEPLREAKVPVVVAFWHFGVVRSTDTGLSKLGLPILVATSEPPRGPEPGFRFYTVDGPEAGTRFLLSALKELKTGGIPALAADGLVDDNSPRFPFLRGEVAVPTGLAILARRSGARIVPATSRWLGLRAAAEFRLHPPVEEPAVERGDRARWETALLANTVKWFEGHLLENPGDLRPLNFRTG